MIKTTKYKYKTFISWDFSSAKLYLCTSYCWEACTALFFFLKLQQISHISALFQRMPFPQKARNPVISPQYCCQALQCRLWTVISFNNDTISCCFSTTGCQKQDKPRCTFISVEELMCTFLLHWHCKNPCPCSLNRISVGTVKQKNLHHLRNFAVNDLATMYWWFKILRYIKPIHKVYTCLW